MPHPDLLAVLKPIFEKALERPPPTTTTKSTISVSIALIIRYQHFMHEKEKVACFEHNKTPTRAVFLTAFSFLSFSNFFFATLGQKNASADRQKDRRFSFFSTLPFLFFS